MSSGSMGDWDALDKMFQEQDTSAVSATPTATYGRDGPVKVTGMTPGMIGPAKTAKMKKSSKPTVDPNEIWADAEVREEGDPDMDVDDGCFVSPSNIQ